MNVVDPQHLFQQAVQFHRQGRLAEAEGLYQQLIAGLPMSAEPRHFLGILRLQQGRFAEALDLIGAAIRINPKYAEAYGNLGAAYEAMGELPSARQAYERGLQLSPNSAFLASGLARVNAEKASLRHPQVGASR